LILVVTTSSLPFAIVLGLPVRELAQFGLNQLKLFPGWLVGRRDVMVDVLLFVGAL
jgi:hypothetical protein